METSEEMITAIDEYVEYVDSLMYNNAKIFIEKRLSFEQYVKGGFGTVDALVINENTAHVIDFKYGKYVKIDACENEQLMLYAVAVMQHYDTKYNFKNFELHIVQPRMNNYSTYKVNKDGLIAFANKCKYKSEQILNKEVYFKAGDKQCTYCNFNSSCKTLKNKVDDVTKLIHENTLTNSEISEVLNNEALVKKFLTSVNNKAFAKLKNNEKIQGYTLKKGRSIRKFNENAEEVLLKKLGNKAFETKLKTLTSIEKTLGKSEFQKLNITYKSTPKLSISKLENNENANNSDNMVSNINTMFSPIT